MTQKARYCFTDELLLNRDEELVARAVGERLLPDTTVGAVVVVERHDDGRGYCVTVYRDFTPDYPPAKIIRGVVRRLARRVREGLAS